ncbi:MAG: 50S ribosomal protein L9 [Chitinophagales bacterium]|nr:MAG: 50S ribosomal protein L9 [Chitinophagales bacterium]
MEVVLLQDIENLGSQYQIVKVKPGYARNYLIPRGLALIANEGNRKMSAEKQKQAKRREEKLLSQLQSIVDQLKMNAVRVGAKVGTSGKIFGSVTTLQIAEAIKKQFGVTVDRKKITILEEDIKVLGTYKALVDLHKDVKVEIDFEVVAE